MKLEEIRIRDRVGMRGLKNRGLIEVSQDPKTGEFVLVASKGIQRKWLIFNFPQAMWRGRGSKEEALQTAQELLQHQILAD